MKNPSTRLCLLAFLVLGMSSRACAQFFDFTNATPDNSYITGNASVPIANATVSLATVNDLNSVGNSTASIINSVYYDVQTPNSTTDITANTVTYGFNRLQASDTGQFEYENDEGPFGPGHEPEISYSPYAIWTPPRYIYIGNLTYRVNFQSSGAPPSGYVADNGNAFGSNESDNATYSNPVYGWLTGNATMGGNTSLNGSYALMAPGAVWKMQLPAAAARYWVTVTVGNSSMGSANYTLVVKGQAVPLVAANSPLTYLYQGGVEVEVADGNLTVQNNSPGIAPLCHVEVTHLGQPSSPARYVRGTGYNPAFQSFVIPLDGVTGTELSQMNITPGSSQAYPWFATVPYVDPGNFSSSTYNPQSPPAAPLHLVITNGNITNGTAINGNVSYGVTINGIMQNITEANLTGTGNVGYLTCDRPIVAFGNSTWGGSTLFTGRTYNFGVFSGWMVDTDNLSAIVVAAYNRTQYNAGLIQPQLTYISIPATNHTANDSAWQSFVANGFCETITANDLQTTVKYLPSYNAPTPNLGWDVDSEYGSSAMATLTNAYVGLSTVVPLLPPGQTSAHFPFIITHLAQSNDYYYVVYGIGRTGSWVASGANLTYNTFPMAGVQPGNSTLRYEPLYALEFSSAPAWQANVLTLPNFNGVARPPDYNGTSVGAASGLPAPGQTFNGTSIIRPNAPFFATNLTVSGNTAATWQMIQSYAPEFYDSAVLDNFVQQMGNNPFALAAYVQNNIQVTDMLGGADGDTTSNNAFNWSGMDRSALGTFLEGQGSPLEQCALLIYLLRQAGYNAVYVFPPGNQTILSLEQLQGLTGVGLAGNGNLSGNGSASNEIFDLPANATVNYPWVAVETNSTSGNTTWVNLFPWLKDVGITEGPDLWGSLPLLYQRGYTWLDQYLRRDNVNYSNNPQFQSIFSLVAQDGVELPSVLFPRFVNTVLNKEGAGFDISQVGLHRQVRTHTYSQWADFPVPLGVSNSSANWHAYTDLSNSSISPLVDGSPVSFYNQITIQAGGTQSPANLTLPAPEADNARIYLAWNSNFTLAQLIAARPYGSGSGNFAVSPAQGPASLGGSYSLNMTYTRNQRASNSNILIAGATLSSSLAVHLTNQYSTVRPFNKGDVVDICVKYGRVTDAMLALHADAYNSAFQAYKANTTTGNTTANQAYKINNAENMLSLMAALNGYQYFKACSIFEDECLSWNDMAPEESFSMGISKIGPPPSATATTDQDVPRVDMFFSYMTVLYNQFSNYSFAGEEDAQWRNFMSLWALESSAQEQVAPQTFFGQSNAISTVRLLHLVELSGNSILEVNANNLTASIDYEMPTYKLKHYYTVLELTSLDPVTYKDVNVTTVGGEPLSQYEPALNYGGAVTSFLDVDPESVAYVTPQVEANGNGNISNVTFEGLGVLIVSNQGIDALITNLEGGTSEGGSNPVDTSLLNIGDLSLSTANSQNYGNVYSLSSSPTFGVSTSDPLDNEALEAAFVANNTASNFSIGASTVPLLQDLNTVWSVSGSAPGGSNNTADFTVLSTLDDVSSIGASTSWYGPGTIVGATMVSDPVDTATGELYVDDVDISLAGPLPLQLRRNYSSIASGSLGNGLLGYGWKLNLMPYLVPMSNITSGNANVTSSGNIDLAKVTVFYGAEEDGSIVAYRKSSNPAVYTVLPSDNAYLNNYNSGAIGSIHNMFNANLTISNLTSTHARGNYTFLLSRPDGSVATYQEMSFPFSYNSTTISRDRPYLTSLQDAKGNSLSFSYYGNSSASSGQLENIQSSNGNFLAFEYDPYGHVTDVITNDGRDVHYDYNVSTGDLIDVIRPDGSEVSYTYLEPSSSQANSNVYHLLTEIDDPEGRRLVNTYNTATRQVTSQQALAGPQGQLVTVAAYNYSTNATNNTTITTVTDALGNTTTYTYYTPTSGSNLSACLLGNITDPLSRKLSYTWFVANNTGNFTIFNGSTGATSTISANSTYYPRSVQTFVDQRGLTTNYQYNGTTGDLVQNTMTGDLVGNSSSETATYTYGYTSSNLCNLTQGPSFQTFTTYGTANGTTFLPTEIQTRTSAADGNVVVSDEKLVYGNSTGNLTVGAGAGSTGNVTNITISAAGLLCEEYVGDGTSNGTVTGWAYDGHGYPIEKVQYASTLAPPTNTTVASANTLATPTPGASTDFACNYTNDLRGNVLTESDPGNIARNYSYDAMGRCTMAQVVGANQTLSQVQIYYDGNGLVSWIDGPQYGPADSFVSYSYTPLGQLSAEIHWRTQAIPGGSGIQQVPGASQMLNQTIHLYAYDANGNLIRETDSNGNYKVLTYDAAAELISTAAFDSDDRALGTFGFTHEPGGKIASSTDPLGGNTSYVYTSTGQVGQQSNPDGTVHQWRYNSNGDGRLASETLPNTHTWTTTYNDGNRTATATFSGSENGNTPSLVTVRDPRGNVISQTDVDGFNTTTTYDGLNRPQTITGPAGTGSSAQRVWSYSYNLSNLTETVGEGNSTSNILTQTVTQSDGLGRPTQLLVESSGGNIVRQTSIAYAANNFSSTITENGTTKNISQTRYVDEAGRPILTQYKDNGYTIQNYDAEGNLLSAQDQAGRVTNYTYDGLNRLASVTEPDGAVEKLGYDALGHLTARSLPGGLNWTAVYNSFSQLTNETLASGNLTERQVNYAYYASGDDHGLLETATHVSRGTSVTYNAYSAFDRAANITFGGNTSGNIPGFTRTYGYDNRGNVLSANDTYSNTTFANVSVTRAYDGYSQLLSDQVAIAGSTVSNLTNVWDGAGRRLTLHDAVAGADRFAYTYDASGRVTNVAEKIFSDFNFAYAFDTNQLPISRSTPWANVTYSGNFDLCGRPLGLTRKEGSAYSSPLTLLSENLTWNADNRMASYGVVRGGSGAGNYSDARAYTYDGDGRLANETFAANATANAASVYAFDANNLGVRITANSTATVSNTTSALNSWAVANGGLDGLGQTLLEERGGETLTANGTTNGRGVDSPAIRLTLTSNTSPVAAALGNIAFNATTGNWTAPLLLGPGNYTLTATAAHPSGQYNATAVSNFTLNATSPYAAAQTENLFDGDGYISGRVSGNGTAAVSTDTNTWDGAGRLLKIARRNASNNGFDEAAVYDPFGRRVRDVYSPVTSGNETGNETTDSWFDPAVAYLEVAANQTGNLSWKVYGPDAGGAFGGMQGLGALEAVLVPGNNTASGVWNDSLGHVVAYSAPANVSGAPSAPVWNVYSSGYGPLPGQTALRWSQTVTANVTTNVFAATLSWQGRRIDASGYFWLGARIYDPTGGKFLAPDPLGQAASWDLYSYAAGDPINRADPTGAVSSDLYSKIENLSADQIQMQMSELDINGEIPTYGQWFVGQAVEGLGEGAVILGQAALMLTGVGELEAPVLAEEAGLAAEEGAVGTEVLAGEGFAEAGEAGIEQAAGGEIAAEGGGEIAGGGGGGQMEFGFAAETTGQAPAAAAPGGQMEFSFAQEAESAAPAAEAEAPGQSYLNFGGGGSASPGLTQGELNLPAEAAESGGSTALSTLRQTTDGESFFHYGYGEQASGYAGGLKPGGYVTSAGDLTGAEARSGLALPGGRPLPNSVYQVTPEPGTWIRVNPVTSPQFGQPGGLPEFQFPYGTGPGTVGSPTPLP